MTVRISKTASQFGESLIRDMTRVLAERGGKPAVNLAQGFPDFPAPPSMKDAACEAIRKDINQYAITWGARPLRQAIAGLIERHYGTRPDFEREITVTCGTTEAMMAAMLTVTDPGDEVIIFEPFYENYGPDTIISGATPRFVQLHEPDWRFDEKDLAAAFNARTRAIVINTPGNPTGKVFSRAELEFIAKLCQKWNVVAITDEIYEFMTYDVPHVRMADVPGMEDRTITISGLSKTWAATGWRVGWMIASPVLTAAIRKVHDFLTCGAAAPLQEGAAHALSFPDSYYTELNTFYRQKRDMMMAVLEETGFEPLKIAGAYYIMTDVTEHMKATGHDSDIEFAHWLAREVGVAAVPGSAFYRTQGQSAKLRFCFCKKDETLTLAADLLRKGFQIPQREKIAV